MPVYVDDVRHPFGRMIMCHMWADTLDELHAMADAIGLQRKWFQCPPKASWQHYDISLSLKAKALARGAILTDKYGPLEFLAYRHPNIEYAIRKLQMIESCRARDRARLSNSTD